MSVPGVVDRCVCKQTPFAALLPVIVRECAGLSEREAVERIGDLTQCGRGCGTCKPYLRLVVRTGRVRFGVLDAEQAARLEGDL